MTWKGKTVLVTGAGGFIGSHLVEKLVELGATTKAFVHYRSNGSWGWLDESPIKNQLQVVSGDVRDADRVLEALDGCQVVFHLAALIGIPYSYHAPQSYVETNILGTLNLLSAARRLGVERFIHTSTSEVYGTALQVPIREDHALQGQSPYSASKIAGDKMAEAFHLSFEVPVVTVRPFNTYGPRQSARAVIPTIMTQCLSGKPVKLGNRHPTRDFNFVDDTVNGFLRAAEVSAAIGKTINIGSGREISIGALADLIAGLTGQSIDIQDDTKRIRPKLSEVERLLADTQLASKVLNWKPAVSLEEGLKRTLAWTKDHLSSYRPEIYAI